MRFHVDMDKINNVSFTGIRNIGAVQFKRKPNTISMSLSATLKDDFNGKDLTEFNSVLKKTFGKDASKFKNPNYNDLLNVEFITKHDTGEGRVLLNGDLVAVNDNNLPMFTYLAKITRKIAALSDDQMPVDASYKGFYANETLVNGKTIFPKELSCKEMQDNMAPFFKPDSVRYAANVGNKFIQKMMEIFLDI